MTVTLEQLEQRLSALEQEMRGLRQLLTNGSTAKLAASGSRGVDDSWTNAWEQLLKHLGIYGQPIRPESVQEMVAACGFKTEDNAFSREIVAMREE